MSTVLYMRRDYDSLKLVGSIRSSNKEIISEVKRTVEDKQQPYAAK